MSETETKVKQLITQYANGMIFCDAFKEGLPVATAVKDYFEKYGTTPVGKTYILTVQVDDDTNDACCTFMKSSETTQTSIAQAEEQATEAPRKKTDPYPPGKKATPATAPKPEDNTERAAMMKGVKFYIELQGKTYVTQAGLENETHKLAEKLGGQTTHSSVVLAKLSEHAKHYTVKCCVAIIKDGEVLRSAEAHGYADIANTGLAVQKHLLHMAETRAYNRAMRHLTNINVTSMEELDKVD